MGGVAGLDDFSVEPVVFVRGVLDCSGGAVRFNQAVLTLHVISVTLFRLFLDVTSVFVIHSVFELVLGMSLQNQKRY